jgi:hypothetical protein
MPTADLHDAFPADVVVLAAQFRRQINDGEPSRPQENPPILREV